MLKSVREDPDVTAALQRARAVYPRVWDAFNGLCWLLARQQVAGTTIQTGGNIFYLHKQDTGAFGAPRLTVIYNVSEEVISVRAIKIG